MFARARRLWWRYAVVALPLIGIGEVGAHIFQVARAPRFDDYAALEGPVRALYQPGDLIVSAPRWSEPMVRRALGDTMMPLAHVARPDDDGFVAAIEISTLGERDATFDGWREIEQRSVGGFVVRRLENPTPEPFVFDFVDATDANVTVVSDGRRCGWRDNSAPLAGGLGGNPTFPARRFVCGGSPFYSVGVTVIADQDFRPRRCIWAHPPAHGVLRITHHRAPLGQHIVGHGGLYWMIERELRGAPIRLSVEVAGETIGTFVHRDGDGWSRFAWPLGRHAGTSADVSWVIESDDNAHRHFCFEARTR